MGKSDEEILKMICGYIMDTLGLCFFGFHSLYKLSWNINYGFSEKESLYYRQEIITTLRHGNTSRNNVSYFLKY